MVVLKTCLPRGCGDDGGPAGCWEDMVLVAAWVDARRDLAEEEDAGSIWDGLHSGTSASLGEGSSGAGGVGGECGGPPGKGVWCHLGGQPTVRVLELAV